MNKNNNKITISFTKTDDDLVEFLEELKEKNKASEFIREAIREKINRGNEKEEIRNESVIMTELKKILEKIEAVKNPVSTSKEVYDDDMIVSKENRFGTVEEKKEKKSEDLDEVMDFFDF